MTLQEGDPAPDFAMPATGGRPVSNTALRGRPFVAVFLSKGGHAGLHQGGLRVPGGAAPARPPRHRRDRRVPDKMRPIEKFAAKDSLTFPLASDAGQAVEISTPPGSRSPMYGRKYMGISAARSSSTSTAG